LKAIESFPVQSAMIQGELQGNFNKPCAQKRAIEIPSLIAAPISPRQSCVRCWKGEINTISIGKAPPVLLIKHRSSS
jgi:hypothetical protein